MTAIRSAIVKWTDSSTLRGWHPINSSEHGVAYITSLGWVVKETPTEITLSASMSCWGNCADAITIPKSCVKSIKRLGYKMMKDT